MERESSSERPPLDLRVENNTEWCNVSVGEADSPSLTLSFFNPGKASTCDTAMTGYDAKCTPNCHDHRVREPFQASQEDCCAACDDQSNCTNWVFATDSNTCYLLKDISRTRSASNRVFGGALGGKTSGFKEHLLQASGSGWSWKYGAQASGNLLGTIRPTPSKDLAGCCNNPDAAAERFDPKYALQPGLLSREGWAVISDDAPFVDNGTGVYDEGWISTDKRRNGDIDDYLFQGPGDHPGDHL